MAVSEFCSRCRCELQRVRPFREFVNFFFFFFFFFLCSVIAYRKELTRFMSCSIRHHFLREKHLTIVLGMMFIMPRCACAAKHTVVTLCVCVCSERICFFRGLWAQVSVSTDIIPCFLSMQFADLQDKALFLRYGNICLPRRLL